MSRLWGERRPAERGQVLPVWGIAAGAGLVAVAAAVIGAVIFFGSKPPVPTLTVTASPSRDADQNLTIAFNYAVHYPSTAYAATLTSFPTLTCTIMQQQLGNLRQFSVSGDVPGTDQDVTGTVTKSISGGDRNIQGAYDLDCVLSRDTKQLTTYSTEFAIPPPEYPSPAPSESAAPGATETPAADIDGDYTITWGESVGGCGSAPPPTALKVTSGSPFTVTLGGYLTMTGTVNGLHTFRVMYTGSDGTGYTMQGTFQVTTSPITISDAHYSVGGDTGGCGYTFTATHN